MEQLTARDLEQVLEAFADAWNRHDVDGLMSMMTDDCAFHASAGSDVCGERHEGRIAVRAAYEAVFAQYPDARWNDARHFVAGDRGVSEWTFTGTLADGRRVEVDGCDLLTLRNGRIAVKNSFRKNRPASPQTTTPAEGEHMDNVTLLKNLYDSFGRGDIPTVLGAMSPAIRWHQAESSPYRPSGEAWVGPDAVLNNLFMRLGGEWEGFTVHPKAFWGAGDTVIVEGRYTGAFKATGNSMDIQFCHVWDVKDGKVTRFQQYVDTARLRSVMGMQ